jgi:tetratricopeptide (TPR) repeat protein
MTDHVQRREERLIEEQVDLVRADSKRRVVLLYGPGGVGKTKLVRELARRHGTDTSTKWLEPVDVDDARYWLVSNLERFVSERLDPTGEHFDDYYQSESNVQRYTGPLVGTETVLSHLRRMRRAFVECYRSYINTTKNVVVITLDTVETIRTMDLLRTVVRAMHVLPGTLFVLSGRPPSEEKDPLRHLLVQATDALQPVTVTLNGFTEGEAEDFLERSAARRLVNADERRQLIRLTEGSPLWLELAVEYLTTVDRPELLTTPGPAALDRLLPNDAEPTAEGRLLREEFKRTLVSRFKSLDYWSEVIRRLAVLRYSIDQPTWSALTDDLERPAGISMPEMAWHELLDQPWVRPRANRTLVTLHDALAEELAQRVIPWYDADGTWRRRLWADVARSHAERIGEPNELRRELDELTDLLRAPLKTDLDTSRKLEQLRALSEQMRELDQLNTAWLHYALLTDPSTGADLFLRLYDEASGRHDIMFQELICHEMERFLPNAAATMASPDVLLIERAKFHRWLAETGQSKHVRIILGIARFLTDIEQPESAITLLDRLTEPFEDPDLRYRMYNQRGNAAMRIRGLVDNALTYFKQALRSAGELPDVERELRVAQARKELGFYYRNLGDWDAADNEYQLASIALGDILRPGADEEIRAEMASIQTNWAYLKALQGNYQDSRNLVNSAIATRERLGDARGIAMSLSVSGEVYRYQDKYRRAWWEYEKAEARFEAERAWPWLGLVYQEQAICLHQASNDQIPLFGDIPAQRERAEDLIRRALDICHNQGIRSYPSALNRAGRIIGHRNPDKGLELLDQAIDEADRLADGWFLAASLIEYFELCYRAWRQDRTQRRYRDYIDRRTPEIERAIGEYSFADLPARWGLLRGHLIVEDTVRSGDFGQLELALEHYQNGFTLLAREHVGSHGKAAIGDEFETFEQLYCMLPEEVQVDWYPKLRASWSQLPDGQRTSLLALLDKLV